MCSIIIVRVAAVDPHRKTTVEPGDLQRAVGPVLVGSTLLLALHAAEVAAQSEPVAIVVVAAIVAAVIVASLAGEGSTVARSRRSRTGC